MIVSLFVQSGGVCLLYNVNVIMFLRLAFSLQLQDLAHMLDLDFSVSKNVVQNDFDPSKKLANTMWSNISLPSSARSRMKSTHVHLKVSLFFAKSNAPDF